MLLSFIAFMVIFATIGLWSARKSTGSTEDYLLASRHVPAWLTGLSAVATNNSGYMFIGIIGYTYSQGLSAVWLMIGWVVGDFLASKSMYEKLRVVSGRRQILSFSGLMSRWHGVEYRSVRILAGIITVFFLAAYAAAQLKAGSKALHVLLGWDYSAGAILGTVIVVMYCLAGGIRASIWTDAAQSFVMLFSMAMLCVLSISRMGGVDGFVTALHAVSPTYMNWFPQEQALGPVLGPIMFVVGWLAGGFGVAGQPHVMVRFMAVDNVASIARARLYYYSWYASFYGLAILVGLATRLLVAGGEGFDMELALPLMAQELLPPAAIGLVLAGLFAATMSTADSQILSCTASVTQDLFPSRGQSVIFAKIVTMIIAGIALSIALSDSANVFALVMVAWSGLGSAFIPLLMVHVLGGQPSERLSFMMIVAGLAVAIGWLNLGYGDLIYEIVPGLLAGWLVYFIGRRLGV